MQRNHQFDNGRYRRFGFCFLSKSSGYQKLQIAIIHHFGKVLRGNLLKVCISDNLGNVVDFTNIMKICQLKQLLFELAINSGDFW
jgi:hypothetical protein